MSGDGCRIVMLPQDKGQGLCGADLTVPVCPCSTTSSLSRLDTPSPTRITCPDQDHVKHRNDQQHRQSNIRTSTHASKPALTPCRCCKGTTLPSSTCHPGLWRGPPSP